MFLKTRQLFAMLIVLTAGASCDSNFGKDILTDGVDIPLTDGIDSQHRYIERTTRSLDLSDVQTIRVELPQGRVTLSQSGNDTNGSMQVTEIITKGGLNDETLADLLAKSEVSADRSFVDDTRLDVEATLATDLADTDIVFDVRLVVPLGSNVEVVIGSGPVQVTDVTGNVEVRTENGEVILGSITGNVIAQTTGRPITIRDTLGSVEAETTDADVTLRLAPGNDARVSATTTTGAIHIELDKATAARLDLQSLGGDVNANLGGFTLSDLNFGQGYLQCIVNGGGGSIEAISESGLISFSGM